MSKNSFSTLAVSEDLKAVINEIGHETLTPIQEQAIPLLLDGHDLIGQSQTGSGKTLAFSLPILQKLELDGRELQAMILCPTRELCAQVAREMRRLGRRHKGLHVLILSGGLPGRPQAEALEKGAHIVVGTPGRVLDHINRGRLNLSGLRFLVLDEADRMLDMGFQEDMALIMDEAPSTRQTIFFSATFPDAIKSMCRKYQHSPKHVTIEETEVEKPKIHQQVIDVEVDEKPQLLVELLRKRKPQSAIIFCNLKVIVAEVASLLAANGISSDALHGDLEQFERDLVLAKFRNGSTRVLVATDVAARGLDVTDLHMVINYDLPRQPEDYVHRIGRTGRAGRAGVAVTLVNGKERLKLLEFARETGFKIEESEPERDAAGERAPAPGAGMKTLSISGGRKDKVRPGDILGALTGEAGGLNGDDVGKIEIHDHISYVAVKANLADHAMKRLSQGRIKGRKFLIRMA